MFHWSARHGVLVVALNGAFLDVEQHVSLFEALQVSTFTRQGFTWADHRIRLEDWPATGNTLTVSPGLMSTSLTLSHPTQSSYVKPVTVSLPTVALVQLSKRVL